MQKLLKIFSQANSRNHFARELLKYSAGLMFLMVPLFPKFPLFNLPGIRVAVRVEDFLVALVVLLWLAINLKSIKKFISDNLIRSFILFWIVGLLSLVSAILLTQTVTPHVGMLHLFRRIEYMLPFFVGLSVIRSRRDLRFFVNLVPIVILYVFVVGVGQKYFTWPVITTQNDEYSKGLALFYTPHGHLVSTFAGHYDMASFLILVLPLTISLIIADKKIISSLSVKFGVKSFRLYMLLASIVGFWLLIEAASRISIASYLVSIFVVLVLTRRIKFIPIILSASFALTIIIGGTLESRYIHLFQVFIDKISSIFSVSVAHAAKIDTSQVLTTPTPSPTPVPVFEDRSTNIRLAVEWPRAIRAFMKNPLLGTGYSSITLATDNEYLRLLGETGIFGGLSLTLVFVRILKNFVHICIHRSIGSLENFFALCILSAIPGILLTMVFIDILEASKFAILFWFILGVSVKSIYLKKNYEK